MITSLFTSAPRFAPLECAPRVRAGEALLVDVREPGEWTSGVAQQAVLLSLTDLTGSRARWKPFLAANAGREMLLYCASVGGAGIGVLSWVVFALIAIALTVLVLAERFERRAAALSQV